MKNQTIYLKDYTPPHFEVLSLALDISLFEDKAYVKSTMKLERKSQGLLKLLGENLVLKQIKVNHHLLNEDDYHFEGEDLVIHDINQHATLEIETEIYPQKNTALSGLYRSNHLFCTQCEAEGFRRITYFLDRPDVLTTYTTRIEADEKTYPVLLSNGNLIEQGHIENGRHFAVWHDPFKKPSYLFALVAGQLSFIQDKFTTRRGREIDLKIYVEPGQENKCAHAMIALKKAMKWDEERYGREYDLDIFMIVAVSDFNMGAMENKGLNIFNAKYILADTASATDKDYADIEGVVAHEYFHNWTGNRVTCRDWFQLSLKEGLTVFRDQAFSQEMNAPDVCRIQDVNLLRIAQFPEDASALAHPVQPEAYEEINNFYTATIYNKGAEVIRMQHTLFGQEGFRRGTDLYFERHDGQAVTIDDFLKAMSEANAVDLTQFKRWYTQAGTPVVTVKEHQAPGLIRLSLTQYCPPTRGQATKAPFHIPIKIAFFTKAGRRLEGLPSLIELKQQEEVFTFKVDEPVIVSILRDFSAPVIIKQTLDEASRLIILQHETDGFSRWEAAQALALGEIIHFMAHPDHTLSTSYVEALKQLLKSSHEDKALLAELLTPPNFELVQGEVKQGDVDNIEIARQAYRVALGQALYPLLKKEYQALVSAETHEVDAASYARRSLKNVILSYLFKANEAETIPFCQKQLNESKTMTDQIASLYLLAGASDAAVREQALNKFYKQWSHDELVLDKWFSAQAVAQIPSVLSDVKRQLTHPAFSFKNPNKVRALIGAFCQSNPRAFHHLDGSGYVFLQEMLLKLDGINPQISARLATPLSRAKSLDSTRQGLIKKVLQTLSNHSLSKDLREMVDKSLESLS